MSDLILLSGLDEWIEPNRPVAKPDLPKRTWRQRLTGFKPYRVEVRLEPAQCGLTVFGLVVARRLGTDPPGPPEPTDRALYLTGIGFGWTARLAADQWVDMLGKKLDGIRVKSIAMRVSR